MKKILLMLAVVTANYCSYAQNIFPSSGNVGIGTTAPRQYLDIWGGALNVTGADINGTALVTSYHGYAYYCNDALGNGISISPTGNVGIGTRSSLAKFAVYQSDQLGSLPKNATLLSTMSGYVGSGNTFQHNTWLVRNTSGNDWYSSRLHDGIAIDVSFQNPQTDTRTWWERDPYNDIQSWGNSNNTYLTISQSNVGIGTTAPDAKLSVNGTIHTKEVKVDLTGWPDYVFKPKYKLPALTEVKTYLDKNQHLPDMPSAAEVEKNGVNLGEIIKVQTKKIEELTLYLIEKDKQLAAQNKKIENQQAVNESLQKQIDQLAEKLKN